MGGTATPLKNGSAEPSGSSQTAVHEWYLNTPLKNGSLEPSGSSYLAVHEWYLNILKEWFFGDSRKITNGCPWVVSQHPFKEWFFGAIRKLIFGCP